MSVLVDTSILVRLANTSDPLYPVAAKAILELHRRDEELYVASQILIEFGNVATRPQAVNGLGISAEAARTKSAIFEAAFSLAPETADVFPAWKAIADDLGILGKQVHDARLVAVCAVNGISHLLTFNVGHFSRLANCPPRIVIIDPATI